MGQFIKATTIDHQSCLTIVQIGQNGRHQDRNTFAIYPGPSFKINAEVLFFVWLAFVSKCSKTWRVTFNRSIVIFVSLHPRDKATGAIVFEEVSQVSQRLNCLLVQHHMIDSALEVRNDVADSPGEVSRSLSWRRGRPRRPPACTPSIARRVMGALPDDQVGGQLDPPVGLARPLPRLEEHPYR